jgi:hypothetical protein
MIELIHDKPWIVLCAVVVAVVIYSHISQRRRWKAEGEPRPPTLWDTFTRP